MVSVERRKINQFKDRLRLNVGQGETAQQRVVRQLKRVQAVAQLGRQSLRKSLRRHLKHRALRLRLRLLVSNRCVKSVRPKPRWLSTLAK